MIDEKIMITPLTWDVRGAVIISTIAGDDSSIEENNKERCFD
jgi:hypothetical protein